MVVVARLDADLLAERGVDEVDVAEVAVQEGEGRQALRVREHRRVEDDALLLVRPPLDVLAADDVHDALVWVDRHHDRRSIEDTCGSGQFSDSQTRAQSCSNKRAAHSPTRRRQSVALSQRLPLAAVMRVRKSHRSHLSGRKPD